MRTQHRSTQWVETLITLQHCGIAALRHCGIAALRHCGINCIHKTEIRTYRWYIATCSQNLMDRCINVISVCIFLYHGYWSLIAQVFGFHVGESHILHIYYLLPTWLVQATWYAQPRVVLVVAAVAAIVSLDSSFGCSKNFQLNFGPLYPTRWQPHDVYLSEHFLAYLRWDSEVYSAELM